MAQVKEEELLEFDWLQLEKDIRALDTTESRQDRFYRKVTENPFVPIGVLATTMALGVGLWSFKRGKRQLSQYMMRTRIAAQGFTIVAMVVGLGMGISKK